MGDFNFEDRGLEKTRVTAAAVPLMANPFFAEVLFRHTLVFLAHPRFSLPGLDYDTAIDTLLLTRDGDQPS